MVLYSQNDYKAAGAVYQDILPWSQKGEYVPTLYGCSDLALYYELWGQVLNYQKKYRETADNLPKARSLDPDFSSIHLARAYAALGETSKAIAEYDRYKTRFPDDAIVYMHLGELFLTLDDYQNAERELETAVLLSPNDPSAHLLYGRVLLREGRDADARQHLNKAIELDPSGKVGDSARDLLNKLR